jgi:hypothetical protein
MSGIATRLVEGHVSSGFEAVPVSIESRPMCHWTAWGELLSTRGEPSCHPLRDAAGRNVCRTRVAAGDDWCVRPYRG